MTHVERSHTCLDADITVFVMECGESCVVDQLGNTTPPGFDFYTRTWSFKATCKACHNEIGRKTNENQRDLQRKPENVDQ